MSRSSSYSDTMNMVSPEETAALVALLQVRPGGMRWGEITAEVVEAGSALGVWERLVPPTLMNIPGKPGPIEAAAQDIAAWTDQGHTVLTILDGRYPARLRGVHQAPPACRGPLSTGGNAHPRRPPGARALCWDHRLHSSDSLGVYSVPTREIRRAPSTPHRERLGARNRGETQARRGSRSWWSRAGSNETSRVTPSSWTGFLTSTRSSARGREAPAPADERCVIGHGPRAGAAGAVGGLPRVSGPCSAGLVPSVA